MSLTLNDIMALGPCEDYPRERVAELMAGRESVSLLDVLDTPIPLDDRVWLITEALPESAARLLSCEYAESVLHIFERDHPDDKRPREAIETARRFARGEATAEELESARAAARAAARSAEGAVWDAAQAAAQAAARSAGAVWDAAQAARADIEAITRRFLAAQEGASESDLQRDQAPDQCSPATPQRNRSLCTEVIMSEQHSPEYNRINNIARLAAGLPVAEPVKPVITYTDSHAICYGVWISSHWIPNGVDSDPRPFLSVAACEGESEKRRFFNEYHTYTGQTPEELHEQTEAAIRRVAYLASIDLAGV